jgi:hypothetical protein
VREIRTLRAMWRALETGLRQFLNGHEEGNLGYKPRRSLRAAAPVLDPTGEGGLAHCHINTKERFHVCTNPRMNESGLPPIWFCGFHHFHLSTKQVFHIGTIPRII